MYSRLIKTPDNHSIFLFGPRGTGKTTWAQERYPEAIRFDLLESATYTRLLADPSRLEAQIPPDYQGQVIIDEVQRIPDLLNEVHRLIEGRKLCFILTGSSARKLRKSGTNLLAGRALTYSMHPLTAIEMASDFRLEQAVVRGMLPMAQQENYLKYLTSYVGTYLDQEVLQEGLTRNLSAFSRFLEVASLSQGQMLNTVSVSRDVMLERMMVTGYFQILTDLLIGYLLPPFTKRAKRRLVAHPKFYFFDAGVYLAIRPTGPFDSGDEVGRVALETLVLQQLRAVNDLLELGYHLYFYRTATGVEVDFVLYGSRGLVAIEVKSGSRFRPEMLSGLKHFAEDYPEAKKVLIYTGKERLWIDDIQIIPAQEALLTLSKWV